MHPYIIFDIKKVKMKTLQDQLFNKFSREWVFEWHWANLSLPAKSILIALLAHRDKDGEAFPGNTRLSQLAGLGQTTTTKALNELCKNKVFGIKRNKEKASLIGFKYKYTIKPKEYKNDTTFFIHNFLLHTNGNPICKWSELSLIAKALYIALRAFGTPLLDITDDEDIKDYDPEEYKKRKWDYVLKDKIGYDCMMKAAGISKRSFFQARKELKKKGLLKENSKYWEIKIKN